MEASKVAAAYRKYVIDAFDKLLEIDQNGTPWATFAAIHFCNAVWKHTAGSGFCSRMQRFAVLFSLNEYDGDRLLGSEYRLTHNPEEKNEITVLTSELITCFKDNCLYAIDGTPEEELASRVLRNPPIGFRQWYLPQE
jgi:hypothetical protein